MSNVTFQDFYWAYSFLNELVEPLIYPLEHYLSVSVVKVNPDTNEIDDNSELNSKIQVWLEFGIDEQYNPCHDPYLDCGGNTFEEAIIKLASLIATNMDNKGDFLALNQE